MMFYALHNEFSSKLVIGYDTVVLTSLPLFPQRLAYFNHVLMSSCGLMTRERTIKILCQSSTIRWQPWKKCTFLALTFINYAETW